PMSTSLVRRFAIQILNSLRYLHRHRIIHCDLKPENILLKNPTKSGIKVIDFGSSCFANEIIYSYIQSRFYRAPEVILGIQYSTAIDMWSFGCILCELHTGWPIFPGETEVEQVIYIMEILGLPPKYILNVSSRKQLFFDQQGRPIIHLKVQGKTRKPGSCSILQALNGCNDALFIDFIERCLQWDPRKRLSPIQAIEHKWILGKIWIIKKESKINPDKERNDNNHNNEIVTNKEKQNNNEKGLNFSKILVPRQFALKNSEQTSSYKPISAKRSFRNDKYRVQDKYTNEYGDGNKYQLNDFITEREKIKSEGKNGAILGSVTGRVNSKKRKTRNNDIYSQLFENGLFLGMGVSSATRIRRGRQKTCREKVKRTGKRREQSSSEEYSPNGNNSSKQDLEDGCKKDTKKEKQDQNMYIFFVFVNLFQATKVNMMKFDHDKQVNRNAIRQDPFVWPALSLLSYSELLQMYKNSVQYGINEGLCIRCGKDKKPELGQTRHCCLNKPKTCIKEWSLSEDRWQSTLKETLQQWKQAIIDSDKAKKDSQEIKNKEKLKEKNSSNVNNNEIEQQQEEEIQDSEITNIIDDDTSHPIPINCLKWAMQSILLEGLSISDCNAHSIFRDVGFGMFYIGNMC
ncbi:MAG: putative Dual specificity protein kinase pom1, partial [Streblomastix strix]